MQLSEPVAALQIAQSVGDTQHGAGTGIGSFVKTTAFQSISRPNPSFTATDKFGSVPRYRSVVRMDACPSSK